MADLIRTRRRKRSFRFAWRSALNRRPHHRTVAAGLKVFHLCANRHGREQIGHPGRHIKDALREIHGRLVDEGMRDEITLIVSGGIDAGRTHGQSHHLRRRPCGRGHGSAGCARLPCLPRRPLAGASEETPPETRMHGLCPVKAVPVTSNMRLSA